MFAITMLASAWPCLQLPHPGCVHDHYVCLALVVQVDITTHLPPPGHPCNRCSCHVVPALHLRHDRRARCLHFPRACCAFRPSCPRVCHLCMSSSSSHSLSSSVFNFLVLVVIIFLVILTIIVVALLVRSLSPSPRSPTVGLPCHERGRHSRPLLLFLLVIVAIMAILMVFPTCSVKLPLLVLLLTCLVFRPYPNKFSVRQLLAQTSLLQPSTMPPCRCTCEA